ncbi:unnamed protein product, partial [marine sediment metagenome]
MNKGKLYKEKTKTQTEKIDYIFKISSYTDIYLLYAGALYFGGENIYVSQNSSLMVDVLKDGFSDYSGNIYNDKKVEVFEV